MAIVPCGEPSYSDYKRPLKNFFNYTSIAFIFLFIIGLILSTLQ